MKKITKIVGCFVFIFFNITVYSQGTLSVTGNGNTITNGDITPSVTDDTDFGNVSTGSSQIHTFTLAEIGGTNVNGIVITITGSTAFSPLSNSIGQIRKNKSTTFNITFSPIAIGIQTATVTITSSDGGNTPYTFVIQGNGVTPQPEIDIQGNATSITDGDLTPSLTDDTDFGDADVTTGFVINTFTIFNTGSLSLNLTGTGPAYVAISGTNAADFTVTSNPTTPIVAGGNTTFNITFNPSATGVRTATLTIANDDSDENPYNFDIQGNGTIVTSGSQDINVRGNTIDIPDNDTTPIIADNTDFGSTNIGFSVINTFEIQNTHTGGSPTSNILTVTSITVSGVNAADFTVTSTITTINRGANDTFTITFNPGALGLRTATVTVANNSSVGSEQPYTFDIWGTGTAPSPEINVEDDANNLISDGSTDSPAVNNSTAFGSTDALTPISNTFTIENLGAATLNITSLTSDNTDFAITLAPAATVVSSGSTTFTITFTPSSVGSISAIITIVNNDGDENPFTFTVQGEGTSAPPVYTIYYENFDTNNGGWTIITSTVDTWLWTNSFPVSAIELNEGGFWRNSAYDNYNINTNIVVESPQLDFTGIQNIRVSLDVKYKTENDFDGMRILYSVAGGAYTLLGASGSGTNWYEDNTAALGTDGWNNNSHPANTSFTHSKFKRASLTISDATFSNQSNVKFRIEFSSNGSGSEDGVAFDNFLIEADPTVSLSDASVAPANITSNLRLWLKANTGIANADNTALTLWEDQAYDTTLDKEDANSSSTLAPLYRDSASRNMNYNPVLDFDNNNVEYLNGKGGFFSTDYFAVFRSDDVVDTQTGTYSPGRQFAVGARYSEENFHEDPSGLGMGSTSARYTDEILSHNVSSFPNGSSPPNDNSYGRAYTTTTDSYQNHVLIVNVKSNPARTATEIYKNGKRIDDTTGKAGNGADLNFKEFNNTPFLVGTGRSGLAGRTTSQLNGMLTEIVSYSSPNSAINQQKIQSYLGIKYGVTLQDVSSVVTTHRLNDVDYIDSQGTVIWDTSANTAHNYDIAGIGRDDQSLLDQRQSRSQNDETDVTGPTSGFLTMALTNTYNTNNENISNTTALNDREFLVWGNNNASLDDPAVSITVDMSVDIGDVSLVTNVSFESMTRVWKVKETGGDVPSVEVSIPTNTVRTATPPDGRYLMFISATGVFDPTADYRVMSEVGGYLYADYDFDNTEYITFGWAPEKVFTRSIFFDPADGHYVDVEDALDLDPSGNGFTVSAWINRAGNSYNKSILSKRDATYTEGYDFKIKSSGLLEMSWKNGSTQTITSDVFIPVDEWHHVAVIFSSGTAKLYIDGVLDKTASLSAPTATNQSFFIAAAGKGTPQAFFHGNIDEVRVWDTALSEDQLHYIMNQEIEDNATFVRGSYFESRGITPTKNEVSTIPWSDLAGYYPMSTYTYTNTKDESGNGHQGALKNLQTVDWQTAPLPYLSTQNGDWDTNSTWVNGSVQTMPGETSIVDSTVTIDWNIVRTNHNVTLDNSGLPTANGDNRSVLGLFVDSNELTVEGDHSSNKGWGLTVTHYLNLDGKIDLEGESQLIQTLNSDLAVTSAGTLERDQQGTKDLHTYNYWSSPVGVSNITTNNNSYTLPNILNDGTNNAAPVSINFLTSGYDGAVGPPISIADYWVWKYANQLSDTYSAWQHVRSTGTINAGEGFTMKGVLSTASAHTQEQNYVFEGKPDNGDITISIFAGNDYLIGNPYASAIDSNEFIYDNIGTLDGGRNTNGNIFNGALYFWNHFASRTHVLSEYEGGYATYTLMGGISAVSNDVRINANGGVGTKIPKRYIPVSQGFFVSAVLDTSLVGLSQPVVGGDILFKNSQRTFSLEYTNASNEGSVFLRSSSTNTEATTSEENIDTRPKIRLMFDSADGYHRQLLVGADENASNEFDLGYDAPLIEDVKEDMFWYFNDNKFIIQAVNDLSESLVLPFGIVTNKEGLVTIRIETLENIDSNTNIYIYDKELDIYHDLNSSNYEIFLPVGEYLNRFETTFSDNGTLNDLDNEFENLNVHFSNASESIIIINPTLKTINSVELYNMLGQSIYELKEIPNTDHLEVKTQNISRGTYIIKLVTETGIISKKVLI